MPDSVVTILDSGGATQSVDTRTEAGNTQHRQVIVVGDPSVNAAVAEVASVDPGSSSSLYGQVVRLAGSASVQLVGATLGSLAVHVLSTGGTLQIKLDPSSAISGSLSSLNVHLLSTGGTVQVRLDPSSAISGSLSSLAVHILSIGGTIVTKFAPEVGLPAGGNIIGFANISSTAIIPSATSGAVSTIGGSNVNTIVSPEASRNIKVYAYAIFTTGLVSIAPRFSTGASAGATELWRPMITPAETASSLKGANMAVTPPAYIFATGVGNTLAIFLDAATLVHYSVAYFKESA